LTELAEKRIILIGIAIGLIISVYSFINNLNILFEIAERSQKPSKIHFYCMERIFNICAEQECGPKLLQSLIKDENEHLHELYIKTVGVVGERSASRHLMNVFLKNQAIPDKVRSAYNSILSIGTIGNEEIVPELEEILSDNKNTFELNNYLIARSLFLLTGRKYDYVNADGKQVRFISNPEISHIREIILNSKNRRRTIDEMVEIDRIDRPPGW
jgi:hypothetical protein